MASALSSHLPPASCWSHNLLSLFFLSPPFVLFARITPPPSPVASDVIAFNQSHHPPCLLLSFFFALHLIARRPPSSPPPSLNSFPLYFFPSIFWLSPTPINSTLLKTCFILSQIEEYPPSSPLAFLLLNYKTPSVTNTTPLSQWPSPGFFLFSSSLGEVEFDFPNTTLTSISPLKTFFFQL